jgi:hypothetical protein
MTANTVQQPTGTRFLRGIHLAALAGFMALVIGDHLTSPPTANVAAPADDKAACAPCGAPCTLTEKK